MKMFFSPLIGAAVVAGLVASPALAQDNTHGAGVSWSGGHGGVSWDGGHGFGGVGYGGYLAASSSAPAYRPAPPAYQPAYQMPLRPAPTADVYPSPLRHPNHAGEADRRRQ